MGKKAKTLSFQVGGSTKSISLFNKKTGDMKNTYDVLKEISKHWGNMSNKEKQALAISLAGKNQFEVFTSVLGNFKDAQKATATAMDSSGSAMKENAKYQESLQYKITMLEKQFKDLANKVVNSDFVKAILNAGTVILRFANSDVGGLIIKLGLLSAVAKTTFDVIKAATTANLAAGLAEDAVFAEKAGYSIANLGKSIKELFLGTEVVESATAAGSATAYMSEAAAEAAANTEKATKATRTSRMGLVGMAKAAGAAGIGWAALGAAVALTIGEIMAYNAPAAKYKRDQKKISESQKQIKANQEEINKLSSQKVVSEGDDTRIKLLSEENSRLEENIKLTKEKSKKDFVDSQKTLSGNVESGRWSHVTSITKTQKALEDYNKALDDANTAEETYAHTGDISWKETANKAYDSADKQLKALKNIRKGYEKAFPDNYKNQKGWQEANSDIKSIESTIKKTTPEVRAFKAAISTDKKQTNINKVFANPSKIKDSSTALKAYKRALTDSAKGMGLIKAYGAGTTFGKFSKGVLKLSRSDLPKLASKMGLTKRATEMLVKTMEASGQVKLTKSFKTMSKELKKGTSQMKASTKAAKNSKGGYSIAYSAIKKYAKEVGLGKKATAKLAKEFANSKDKVVDFGKDSKSLGEELNSVTQKLDNVHANSVRFGSDGKIMSFNAKNVAKGVKSMGGSADDAKKAISTLNKNSKIKVSTKQAKKDIDSVFTKAKSKKSTKIKVSANTKEFTSSVSKAKKSATSKPPKVKVKADTSPFTTSANSAISKIDGKHVSVVVDEVAGKKAGKAVGVRNNGTKQMAVVNDNPNGGKSNGNYPELIRKKDGTTFIANGGRETLVQLDVGDTVYTAKETREMLNGNDDEIIPAYAKGKHHAKAKSKSAKRYAKKKASLEHSLNTGKISEASYYKKLKKMTKYTKVTTDQWKEFTEDYYNYQNEQATNSLDHMSSVLDTESGLQQKNIDAELARIKLLRKQKKISADQAKEYTQQAYKAEASLMIKNVGTSTASRDAIQKKLKYYLDKGLLSQEDYYQALDDLADAYKEKITKMYEDQEKQLTGQQSAYELYAQDQQDAIGKQIDALNAKKDATDAANEAEDKAVTLAEKEKDLADAYKEKIRVFKDGAWQYVSDANKIAEAQDALKEAQSDYDSAEIDVQISKLEEQQKAWEDSVSNVQAEQTKLEMAEQLGMSYENFMASQAIQGVTDFASKYEQIMVQLVNVQRQLTALDDGTAAKTATVSAGGSFTTTNTSGYASGTTSAPFNTLARFNEQGDELMIPSSINTLSKGAGVIPHTLSENLMEIGKYSLGDLKNYISNGGNGAVNSNDTYLSIDTVNVTTDDADDFIKQLKNLSALT